MALKACPLCGAMISEYAAVCPKCGRAPVKASYPPDWPEDLRVVLPWASLLLGLCAAAAALIWWKALDPGLYLALGALASVSVGAAACAAGAVFRSRVALLISGAAFLAAFGLGLGQLRVAAFLALAAAVPLAVFLILSVIPAGKRERM